MTGVASPAALSVLTALLEARTGQQTASYRSLRIDAALQPLLRERGLVSPDALVAQLLGGGDPTLGDRIVDALLNQESSFFRDAATFAAIVDVVGGLEDRGRRVRIWSAGCAVGQEPLSLAMLFAERHLDLGKPMPEIVATDVSAGALVRAKAGRFTQFEAQRGLPIRRLMRWFDGTGEVWTAKPELLRHVAFRRMNLVADQPPGGQFDLILCRNVLLYLSPQAKAGVFAVLAGGTAPGGLLALGAGETVLGLTDRFVPSRDHRGFYERAADERRLAANG